MSSEDGIMSDEEYFLNNEKSVIVIYYLLRTVQELLKEDTI